jgi:hypothetical protein
VVEGSQCRKGMEGTGSQCQRGMEGSQCQRGTGTGTGQWASVQGSEWAQSRLGKDCHFRKGQKERLGCQRVEGTQCLKGKMVVNHYRRGLGSFLLPHRCQTEQEEPGCCRWVRWYQMEQEEPERYRLERLCHSGMEAPGHYPLGHRCHLELEKLGYYQLGRRFPTGLGHWCRRVLGEPGCCQLVRRYQMELVGPGRCQSVRQCRWEPVGLVSHCQLGTVRDYQKDEGEGVHFQTGAEHECANGGDACCVANGEDLQCP